MTHRIVVETVCTATVHETWTLDVPDDFDPGDTDALQAALAADDYDLIAVEDEVSDERDRETLSWRPDNTREATP